MKIKQTILKLIIAILLTIAVISIYAKQNNQKEEAVSSQEEVKIIDVEDKQERALPKIADKKKNIIDNCMKAAIDKGVDAQLAKKNCSCFLRVAEEKYPAEKIASILMAKADSSGTENEKANAFIIKQCLEENKTITVDKPTVNVIVGDDKAILPETSSDKKD